MSLDQIESCCLRNGDLSVTILSLGCITQNWRLERSFPSELILGYTDQNAYVDDPFYLGAIVGRVANRISGACFTMNGRDFRLDANEPPNTLHGGSDGLSRQNWSLDRDGDTRVRLSHVSPDGHAGFPCLVRFEVTITLGPDRLIYEINALPDGQTPINLAQHNYYSLGTSGLSDLGLSVAGSRFTRRGPDGIPTGELTSVADSILDFRKIRPVPIETDDNFVLDAKDPAARLAASDGLTLEIHTTERCLQVYAGAGLSGVLRPGAGVALEPQRYPNALNTPAFSSILCTPDKPYYQRTELNLIGNPAR